MPRWWLVLNASHDADVSTIHTTATAVCSTTTAATTTVFAASTVVPQSGDSKDG